MDESDEPSIVTLDVCSSLNTPLIPTPERSRYTKYDCCVRFLLILGVIFCLIFVAIISLGLYYRIVIEGIGSNEITSFLAHSSFELILLILISIQSVSIVKAFAYGLNIPVLTNTIHAEFQTRSSVDADGDIHTNRDRRRTTKNEADLGDYIIDKRIDCRSRVMPTRSLLRANSNMTSSNSYNYNLFKTDNHNTKDDDNVTSNSESPSNSTKINPFDSKRNEMILFLINSWIKIQLAKLCQHLSCDILFNIIFGLIDNDYSLLSIAASIFIADCINLLQIYFRKWEFLKKHKCLRCLCCCCIRCDCVCNYNCKCCKKCKKRGSCCQSHFPKHHEPYFNYIGKTALWFVSARITSGTAQLTFAVTSGAYTQDKFDSLNDTFETLKIFWICYNFFSGIHTILHACKDYFLVYYQFCFYWSLNEINFYENRMIQNKLKAFLSNIGYFWKITIDSRNDQFAKIGENQAISKQFDHKTDCFCCCMYCQLICGAFYIAILILWQTIMFQYFVPLQDFQITDTTT